MYRSITSRVCNSLHARPARNIRLFAPAIQIDSSPSSRCSRRDSCCSRSACTGTRRRVDPDGRSGLSVQQATSALSTADQTGLPAGMPELPDPSTTPAIPVDPTDAVSSTPTPPPPPAGTDPAVVMTATDPPAGPSQDTPAPSQTPISNAVSAISPLRVGRARRFTGTCTTAPRRCHRHGGIPSGPGDYDPSPQAAPVNPPTVSTPAQPQATVTPSPTPSPPAPSTTTATPPTTTAPPPQTPPASTPTPTTAPSDSQYQEGNTSSTNSTPDISQSSPTASLTALSDLASTEPVELGLELELGLRGRLAGSKLDHTVLVGGVGLELGLELRLGRSVPARSRSLQRVQHHDLGERAEPG